MGSYGCGCTYHHQTKSSNDPLYNTGLLHAAETFISILHCSFVTYHIKVCLAQIHYCSKEDMLEDV